MDEVFNANSYREIDQETFDQYYEHRIKSIDELESRINNGLTPFILSVWENLDGSPIDNNRNHRKPNLLSAEVMINSIDEETSQYVVSVTEHFRGIYHIKERPVRISIPSRTFVARPLNQPKNCAFFAPTISEIQPLLVSESKFRKEIAWRESYECGTLSTN